MRVRIEVVGEAEVLEGLRRMGDAGVNAAKKVLDDAMAKALPMAKAQSPVDDNDPEPGGELRASIRVTKARATRSGFVSAGMVAGNLTGVRGGGIYPFVQHFDTTLKHDEGGPFFVERPVLQVAEGVPDALAAAVEKAADG